MPQMSPMYWLFISLFCYINFLMVMILFNSVFLKILIPKFKVQMCSWKWLW